MMQLIQHGDPFALYIIGDTGVEVLERDEDLMKAVKFSKNGGAAELAGLSAINYTIENERISRFSLHLC
jgi:hypothetical protein